MSSKRQAVPLKDVRITDDFWCAKQALMTEVTIPYMERILRDEVPGAVKSHALANFRMAAKEEEGAFYGVVFQDSDVAKWLEAAAYSLAIKPDEALLVRVRDVVTLLGRAQQADGYLGTYFTVKEPENRWANLLECHELYCAGHVMEAACALHEAIGEDDLLRIAMRLADHIVKRFGEGGCEGIPGHQEVEIGLLRMYHTTGKTAYREMALRFLNLRGQDPRYFEKHTPSHPNISYGEYSIDPKDNRYNQSDEPVRKQVAPRGHAVRNLYMLVAMADAAACTEDAALQQACERMFDGITQRQMYVTGSIGATSHQESFTVDYDLPNDRGYGETCAAVAMAFFSEKMLQLSIDGRYSDVLETVLFNGALAGMQLDGKCFFYVNPLEVRTDVSGVVAGYEHVLPQRPQWFNCACCPPNLARLVTSLGKYLWSQDEDSICSHLFIGSTAYTKHGVITLQTGYPWDGNAIYTFSEVKSKAFTLAIHIPGYLHGFQLTLNGQCVQAPVQQGYCKIHRNWGKGDRLEVSFELLPRRIYADPRVRDDAGKVALARGPLIYCLEGVDNSQPLSAVRLPRSSDLHVLPCRDALLDDVRMIEAEGIREELNDRLYQIEPPAQHVATLRFIPYYAWGNRGLNDMVVWVRE